MHVLQQIQVLYTHSISLQCTCLNRYRYCTHILSLYNTRASTDTGTVHTFYLSTMHVPQQIQVLYTHSISLQSTCLNRYRYCTHILSLYNARASTDTGTVHTFYRSTMHVPQQIQVLYTHSISLQCTCLNRYRYCTHILSLYNARASTDTGTVHTFYLSTVHVPQQIQVLYTHYISLQFTCLNRYRYCTHILSLYNARASTDTGTVHTFYLSTMHVPKQIQVLYTHSISLQCTCPNRYRYCTHILSLYNARAPTDTGTVHTFYLSTMHVPQQIQVLYTHPISLQCTCLNRYRYCTHILSLYNARASTDTGTVHTFYLSTMHVPQQIQVLYTHSISLQCTCLNRYRYCTHILSLYNARASTDTGTVHTFYLSTMHVPQQIQVLYTHSISLQYTCLNRYRYCTHILSLYNSRASTDTRTVHTFYLSTMHVPQQIQVLYTHSISLQCTCLNRYRYCTHILSLYNARAPTDTGTVHTFYLSTMHLPQQIQVLYTHSISLQCTCLNRYRYCTHILSLYNARASTDTGTVHTFYLSTMHVPQQIQVLYTHSISLQCTCLNRYRYCTHILSLYNARASTDTGTVHTFYLSILHVPQQIQVLYTHSISLYCTCLNRYRYCTHILSLYNARASTDTGTVYTFYLSTTHVPQQIQVL